ncbi:MAG: NAD-dependent epimerase/dehydratase family protein [Candidatus Micrarchaeota archaeon]|nr:NAD-dependent epimerase/dehydratase family protein [Candidatus Micrarchaeota archaeon]
MRIIITGGTGFVGSQIAIRLIGAGHNAIVLGRGRTDGRNAKMLKDAGAEFLTMDVTSDGIAKAFADSGAEAVVHGAARIAIKPDAADIIEGNRINVLGTFNVVRAALDSGIRSITYLSTAAVYGITKEGPIPETNPTIPTNPYGATKLAGELVAASARGAGVKVFVPRIFNAYGHGTEGSGRVDIVTRIVTDVREGRQPRISGDGSQTRDFISVDDVADAIAFGMAKGLDGAYNIGSGKATSMGELAETIIRMSGSPVRPSFLGGDPGVMHSLADIGRIRSAGWSPKVELAKGLKAFLGQ